MPSLVLEALQSRVLLFDGAMGTQLDERIAGGAVPRPECPETLVLSHPQVVADVHRAYFDAGADIVTTNSFGANAPKLATYGLSERAAELNRAAAHVARSVADDLARPGRPRFVAGSMGPSGLFPGLLAPGEPPVDLGRLHVAYVEQARALIAGGVDVLLIETEQDLVEVRTAAVAARQAITESGRAVAVFAQVTFDESGHMLVGADALAALVALLSMPIDGLGLNCSTGPGPMLPTVRTFVEGSPLPVSVQPNAGLPRNVDGRAQYDLDPAAFADGVAAFVDLGAALVGGCCGTTPEHIRALAHRVAGRVPRPRRAAPAPLVSSGLKALCLDQEPRPLLVGERLNTQGSKAMRRLMLEQRYDDAVTVARDQTDRGAHVLDVCVALTERADEAAQMLEIVRRLNTGSEAPLMIDSTDPAVAAAALAHAPGRCIVNSINLEHGGERADRMLDVVRRHGAAVVALTIDDEGLAITAERKLAVAARIEQKAREQFGIPQDRLILDFLTLTVASGEDRYRRAALETLEAVRAVRTVLPGCRTILGVSNVSYGLDRPARRILNSIFLYHAVQAGLHLAIVNPAEIVPYPSLSPTLRQAAEDVIFDRRPDALAGFIEAVAAETAPRASRRPADSVSAEPTTPAERLRAAVLEHRADGVEQLAEACLGEMDARQVLDAVLLPAMQTVGDRFGAGELILPFVLQSAEVMKRATVVVEAALQDTAAPQRGRVVLATVFGDVHDIGKNLVRTILANNGYAVIDLGRQVPVHAIVEAVLRERADAVGLSAMLVSTSQQMPLIVQALHKAGLQVPVLIGGAAVRAEFAERCAVVDEQGTRYGAAVRYARDAFEGLRILAALGGQPEALAPASASAAPPPAGAATPRPAAPSSRPPSARRPPNPPVPPFWGARAVNELPLGPVLERLSRPSLFRQRWGLKATDARSAAALFADVGEPILRRLSAEATAAGHFQLQVAYGFFPCGGDGDELVLFDPAAPAKPVARLAFAPGAHPGGISSPVPLYLPAAGPVRDVAALQVVTVGPGASRWVEALDHRGDVAESFYVHGFAVELAETLAAYWHDELRRMLGIAPGVGRRLSPGYPVWPRLADQEILFRLLEPERIGVSLTSAWQMVPEQSTSAIVVPYRSVRQAADPAGTTAPR